MGHQRPKTKNKSLCFDEKTNTPKKKNFNFFSILGGVNFCCQLGPRISLSAQTAKKTSKWQFSQKNRAKAPTSPDYGSCAPPPKTPRWRQVMAQTVFCRLGSRKTEPVPNQRNGPQPPPKSPLPGPQGELHPGEHSNT